MIKNIPKLKTIVMQGNMPKTQDNLMYFFTPLCRTGYLVSRQTIQAVLCVAMYYIWFAKFTALCQILSSIAFCISLVVLTHLVGIETKGKTLPSHRNTKFLLLPQSAPPPVWLNTSHDEDIAGLQITVGHWTMADQNLPMSDEIQTVVGHNAQTMFSLPSNAN